MKTILASTGLLVAACAIAFTQDTGGRLVIPPGNSPHPRTVNCNLLNGSITVTTHSGNDILVEGEGGSSRNDAPPGMHRIGGGGPNGFDVLVDDNTVTIRRPNGNRGVSLVVPVNSSLRLHTLSGTIHVDGVHGEVEVHTQNGHVQLDHISGTITADSQNGPIEVSMDRVDPSKPLSFATLNGAVDLTLPPDLKANLSVKTNHGAVYSDFEVTLGPSRVTSRSSGGQYRIGPDNSIHGTINGGGVDLNIHTLNGAVYIRKRK